MADEFDDYEVPWLSEEGCERSAATLRRALGVEAGPLPHIMEVLDRARERIPEAKDLALTARPDETMGRAHAFAKSSEREVIARQSIIEAAIEDEVVARYVLLHELEHVIFHPGPRKFRVATGNETDNYRAPQQSAEWQADQIARAMFMPPEMVLAAQSARDLARDARVPLSEAVARFRQLRGPQQTASDDGAKQTAPPFDELSEFDALKLRLWNALPTIPGEPAKTSRLCGIYRILWSEYGRTTQCGWFLDRGRIVAHFGLRGEGR